ncbi:MAG: hypothetical protein NWF02_01170 [Candidatus Bathyarchaeota archaeon]|nr:hypothetical protein [Candidatus Bathyarchaeum sp.]
MADAKFVVVMSICIVLAAGCIAAGMLLGQKEIELALKDEEIVVMETQKSTLETQIAGLLSEKSALELQVTGMEDEASELNDEVSVLESEVSNLQSQVSGLETDVTESYNQGYSEGYEAGHDEGYVEGMDYVTENGFYLRDPTYDEAVSFIDSDLTDENEYSDDYVCYDFTSDFNANAEEQGFRCGFVYMTFFDGAHAIACFNTVDEGIIYVEPQTDEIVDLEVGQIYNGDVVESLGIIW